MPGISPTDKTRKYWKIIFKNKANEIGSFKTKKINQRQESHPYLIATERNSRLSNHREIESEVQSRENIRNREKNQQLNHQVIQRQRQSLRVKEQALHWSSVRILWNKIVHQVNAENSLHCVEILEDTRS